MVVLASMVVRGAGSSFPACTVSRTFSLSVLPLWSSYLDRFCLDVRIRLVARDDLPLNLAFQQALDVIQELVFVDADQ